MTRKLMIVLLVLVLLVGAAAVWGLTLPRDHVAATAVVLDAGPDDVWQVLTDVEAYPGWRADVQSVKALPDQDGQPVWREQTDFGPLTLRRLVADPPRRLVVEVVDEGQGYGGRWTWELEPVDGATRVTITEAGFIDNPLFRLLAHLVLGLHRTQEAYLTHLARRFGQTAVLVRVR
jgi:uncharacterized protein YndB with AHSA1/START domain